MFLTRFSSGLKFAVCGVSMLGGLVACGAAEGDAVESAEGEAPAAAAPRASGAEERSAELETEAVSLPAGEQGAALGVDTWEFEGTRARGVSATGALLAEFEVHADGALEGIFPEAGLKVGEGADAANSFSPQMQRFADALQVVEATVDRETFSASVEPSQVIQICLINFSQCNQLAAQVLGGSTFSQCFCNPGSCAGFATFTLECF